MKRCEALCLLLLILGPALSGQSRPSGAQPNTRTPAGVHGATTRQFNFGGVVLSFGTDRQDVFDSLGKVGVRTVRDERPDQWIAYSAETEAVIGILRFEHGKLSSAIKSWYVGEDAKAALSSFYDACHSAEMAEVHPDRRTFLNVQDDQPDSHMKSIVLSYEYHSVTLEFGVARGTYMIEVKEQISPSY
jgi:hypothetical protein